MSKILRIDLNPDKQQYQHYNEIIFNEKNQNKIKSKLFCFFRPNFNFLKGKRVFKSFCLTKLKIKDNQIKIKRKSNKNGQTTCCWSKKTKEAIAKAAQAKKGGKKKWTKGKAKDKVVNAVFVEKKSIEGILNNPSKVGKVLTVSTVVDKLKVNGSLARQLMRMMAERKTVEKVAKNGNQWVYSVIGGAKEEKPAAVTSKKEKAEKKEKGEKKN